MSYDRDHLKVLSIFHFILGGLSALAALFPVIHLALGIGLVGGFFPGEAQPQTADSPELFVGWIFVLLASFLILAFLGFAALAIRAGASLANARGYDFCIAIACIECLILPFGTLLGVVTLVILLRPSVKQLFGVASPPDPPAFTAASPEPEAGR